MFKAVCFTVLVSSLLCAPHPLNAQREAVKNKAGDATEPKTAPPSNTLGGKAFQPKKGAGPEGGGEGTAGAGTMATTDGEAKADTKASGDTKASSDTKAGGDAKVGSDAKGAGEPKGGGGGRRGGPGGPRGGDAPTEPEKVAYDFGLPAPDGKNISLGDYKGKVLLIVNLGRKSSYATQLTALEKLNDTYKDKGLVIIGVPSNDFGDAEPGTDAEVLKAYADAKANFLITEKSSLTGVHQLPLYGYLAKSKAIPDDGIHWNYTKFIVDRKGKVVLRFGPDVAPDSLELQANLQEVLDGTWKPKKERSGRGGGEGGGDDGPPMM